MNVKLHHLQLFYYTAKAKGISAAVKIIPYGIQQPAVSQQLIQLEEELGLKLFDRRPFALTPAGEKLYSFLSKFFDHLDGELQSLKDDAGFPIKFGCPSVISAKYLPELIQNLIERFPSARPFITELEGAAIFAALVNGEIDLAVSMSEPPRAKTLAVKKLAVIPMSLILPKGHRFVKDGFWPKSDFAKEKWISLQDRSGGDRELRVGLSLLGISPQFVASTNSVEAALKYVSMGLGVTLMARPPDDLLEAHQVEALPAPELFGSVNLMISWRKDTILENKVLNYIVETAKSISRKYVSE